MAYSTELRRHQFKYFTTLGSLRRAEVILLNIIRESTFSAKNRSIMQVNICGLVQILHDNAVEIFSKHQAKLPKVVPTRRKRKK